MPTAIQSLGGDKGTTSRRGRGPEDARIGKDASVEMPVFPYDTAIKPMFDLLGTPDEHKEMKVYETDHIPPSNEFIKEILAWLDRYLGPVK